MVSRMIRLLILLLTALGLVAPSAAAQAKARGQLFTRQDGTDLRFAIDIEIEPDFHLYHKELGGENATGKPLTVELMGDGFEFAELVWPKPHEYIQEDFVNGGETYILGHEERLVLYGHATLEEGVEAEDLEVKLDGLTCLDNGACFPYKETLAPDGDGPEALFASFPASLAPSADAFDPDPGQGGGFEAPGDFGSGFGGGSSDDDNRAHGTLYARAEGEALEVALVIEIDDEFHLYHEELGGKNAIGKPLVVTLMGEGITFDDLRWPEPHELPQEDYIDGGMTYILGHEGSITLYATGTLAEGASPENVAAKLDGQTCEDSGTCYAYMETLAAIVPGPEAVWASAPPQGAAGGDSDGTPADDGTRKKKDEGLLALILAAIGGGIFALLMPCTYPMIPITISFFTKQAEARDGNVLPLSLMYGAGIVLIFITIGVVVGPLIMAFATHPVTNLVLGSMFVLFAAALFGAITLNPPQSMMGLAGKASMTGGLVGVFLMGMTLVLTSFTCTAPFVGSLLSFAAGESGSISRIVIGMGTFGLTMAIPFMILSLVPGKIQSLPSSGEWMDTLKVSLGFIELAAALKFFSNVDLVWNWGVLSRELFLLLWALIFIIAGVYLLGWIKVKGHNGETTSGRMLAATAFLLFGAYCWHGYKGNEMDGIMTAIIPPYSSSVEGGGHASNDDGGSRRTSSHEIILDDLEAAKTSAVAQSKPVLINFTGYM